MRSIDELRPLTALRLLTIWRESGEEAAAPLERRLLSNAGVLAECCYGQGERVFADTKEVLAELTPREMERLLTMLGVGGQTLNPSFDEARFCALQEV